MSKELNCANCCIGDFKYNLCDCDNGFCKEFKNIGKEEDFFNAVMQRIRPQGEWKAKSFHEVYCDNCGFTFDIMKCDFLENMKFCPNCSAKMKGADDE